MISLLVSNVILAQGELNIDKTGTIVEQCRSFQKTAALRDLLTDAVIAKKIEINENNAENEHKHWRTANYTSIDIGIPGFQHIDPVHQSKNGEREEGSLTTENWDGQTGLYPPDPSGAAGINYYMQAVNYSYQIFNKDGSPATSSFLLNSLWDLPGDGDPIVMYDRFAERWFISQFYDDADSESNGIMIAISQSSDPLGEYFTYTFDYTLFPDYPKYAVWSNGYYMSANSPATNCAVFNRDKMLLGDPTAEVVKMTFPDVPDAGFKSFIPAYAEGEIEPEMNEPCYFFAVQDNSFPGVSTDHIKIFRADIDWDIPEDATLTISQSIDTAPFNTTFSGTNADVPQKTTLQKLDPITSIFMYRAQYRRFNDYNTIVLCQTVDVDDTDRAAIRWYELRDDNTQTWSIYQQGTYAPDEENHRWIGSIAMDKLGNIALGYSFSGPDEYAGLRYTGRLKDDPLGEMTISEQIAIEGEGAQTTGSRYGDYAQMTLDPTDDLTFWFTGEYIGPGGARKTRVFSISLWHLLGFSEQDKSLAYFNAYQPNTAEIIVNWGNVFDSQLNIQLHDINGKLIDSKFIEGSKGTISFSTAEKSLGIYFITINGKNTQMSKKLYISHE
jgi:hypothetical protein